MIRNIFVYHSLLHKSPVAVRLGFSHHLLLWEKGKLKGTFCTCIPYLNQTRHIRNLSMASNGNGSHADGVVDSNGNEFVPISNHDVSDSYILVDIGANLTNKKFLRDIDSVVQRAKESGVQKIMVTGTNVQSSKEALRLTRIFPDVLFSTAGVHPHDATSWDEFTEEELETICSNQECVAMGECGLDFNRNFSPPEVQLEVFEKQVELACKLKKPLFLHEREAHDDMVSILKKYQDKLPPCVLHCFTGNVEQAKTYLGLGLYIGLTGYVWKDKSEDGVRKILTDNVIPLDRLLLETDAPFMYPNTRSAKLPVDLKTIISPRSMTYLNRHCTFQRNEPCSLPATLELVSALMRKAPEEVAMSCTYNAVKLFGLT